MAGRIKIRAQKKGDVTEVKALMRHPMETGMRKDQAGDPIPAHFITEVSVFHGDQPVMQGHWGAAVSANPFWACGLQVGNLAIPCVSCGPTIRAVPVQERRPSAEVG